MKKEIQRKNERKSVCIVCGNEKDGLEIKEDWILSTMRWIKRKTSKNPKNYRLVVCKDDFLKYRKKRDSYERKQIIYVALGVLFLVVLVSFANGRFLEAIFYGGIVVVFLYLLAQLSYVPAVSIPQTMQNNKTPKK